ncbi:MAG: N-methylhydantoinase A [Gammaproteobacteria bacterium]|jgi:N-methylhydantoinase A
MSEISIGIDVGGTHTDLIAIQGERAVRAKAFTTHNDYSEGIFVALEGAAAEFDISVDELLSNQARTFVNGNTIVTNAVTELKGAKVGVLVSGGFADIVRFGRGNRSNEFDDQLQVNLPQIVPKECILEIDERIDRDGNVVVPLERDQVEAAVKKLLELGVDSIAVCFLWCTRNDVHEREAERIIHELSPDTFVTCSISAASVFREYERWMTAILNCFVQPPVNAFVTKVSEGLRARGYRRAVEFFNGLGGVLGAEEVRKLPILLYSSGPAGGAIGAAALARRYGIENLLCGDMGGTSFDTTLIHKMKPLVAQRCRIGPFDTAISLLDIISIGAGGGSLIGLDARGVPKVGPQSAGSMPGPACYGNGGTVPAMTDCMVTMGFLRPDNYLGGRHSLDVDAAKAALLLHVGNAMGWDAEQSSAGAYNLAVANMANALRGVSIRRGYDPRKCTFVAYGGALPMFAAAICRALNITDMIVPNHSSAFSAYGLLEADYIRRKSVTVGWTVEDRDKLPTMVELRDALEEEVAAEIERAGFARDAIQLLHGADFRYAGQLNEMYMDLDPDDILSEGPNGMRDKFDLAYEAEFGPDTAWRNSGLMLVNYVITGIANREKPLIEPVAVKPQEATFARSGTRPVFLPDVQERIDTPIYDSEKMTPGTWFEGPGIIEVRDTTIYVPTNARVERDGYMNFRLTL